MSVQLKFRRGTAAEWTSANPTLAAGEFAIETDTNQFKIGDGATAWTGLAYGGLQGATGPAGTLSGNQTGDINGNSYSITNLNYDEGALYALTYAATITPDVTNGNVQEVTLTGNVTFSAFANPVAGQSLTLIIRQDATGGRTLTSTMLFAGGGKTLSTAANAVDILTVYYDGTNYWANLAKDFK